MFSYLLNINHSATSAIKSWMDPEPCIRRTYTPNLGMTLASCTKCDTLVTISVCCKFPKWGRIKDEWYRKSRPNFTFYRTALNAGRCSHETGLSVYLSVKSVFCDKTQEKYVHIFTLYERSFNLVFWEKLWLVGGDPFYLKIWVNRPRWSEIADFEPTGLYSL